MTAQRYLLAASILLCVCFVGLTLLLQSGLTSWRADLTQRSLYSLSTGTQTTLRQLSEPIDLTFVYTRRVGQDYPAVRAHAARVRELLRSYTAHSAGMLRLREIDPQPFSQAEDEALAAGIVAVETNGEDPLYFGLIGRNAIDDERIIPFLAPERETSFEYDLTRMIARLDQPQPARIALLSSLTGMNALNEEAHYVIRREMSKSYSVEVIEEDFLELPADVDILMLAHPPELTAWQLWQIDQFILNTGRALILLDPAAKTAQGSGPFAMTDRQIRSDLNHFAESWGVELADNAVADTETALAIQAAAGEGRTTIVRHPIFLTLSAEHMSRENLITAELSRTVNLGAAGRFNLLDTAPGRREVLMQTGPAPSDVPAERAAQDITAEDTLRLYKARDVGAANLAVRITGPLTTAFADGRPELAIPDDPIYGELARAVRETAPDHINTSNVDAEIILIADVDMLDDALHVDLQNGIAFADNASLILNALDSLSGGSELMSLRARAPGLRRMERVERMRDAAQMRFFDEQARLEAKLATTQQRLEELQSVGATGGFFEGDVSAELSPEERAELADLRAQIVETRASLRQIERDFRHDIDRLEWNLRLFTLLTGPILILLAGLGLWWRKRRST